MKYNAVIEECDYRSKVLDVGCGTGRFMEMLRDQKLCNCIGIDISDVSIKMVGEKGFQGFKCEPPALPSNLRDKSFDVCTIIETLEHISDPYKTLNNLAKVLKESGCVIVAVPDNCMRQEEYREHVSSFNIQNLHDLLSRNFKVKASFSVESTGHKHLVIKARNRHYGN